MSVCVCVCVCEFLLNYDLRDFKLGRMIKGGPANVLRPVSCAWV